MRRSLARDRACRRGACVPRRASAAPRRSPADLAFQPHPGADLPLAVALATNRAARAPLAAFLHRQAGRAGARISALPHVLRPDAARARCRARRRCRSMPAAISAVVAISIDPRDTPADAAAAKAKYLAALPPRRRHRRLAFPDRVGSGGAPDRRDGRLSLPLRRDARPVHPSRRASSSRRPRAGSAATARSRPIAPELQTGLADAAQGQSASTLLRPILLLCHAAGAAARRATRSPIDGRVRDRQSRRDRRSDRAFSPRSGGAGTADAAMFDWVPFWPAYRRRQRRGRQRAVHRRACRSAARSSC